MFKIGRFRTGYVHLLSDLTDSLIDGRPITVISDCGMSYTGTVRFIGLLASDLACVHVEVTVAPGCHVTRMVHVHWSVYDGTEF